MLFTVQCSSPSDICSNLIEPKTSNIPIRGLWRTLGASNEKTSIYRYLNSYSEIGLLFKFTLTLTICHLQWFKPPKIPILGSQEIIFTSLLKTKYQYQNFSKIQIASESDHLSTFPIAKKFLKVDFQVNGLLHCLPPKSLWFLLVHLQLT